MNRMLILTAIVTTLVMPPVAVAMTVGEMTRAACDSEIGHPQVEDGISHAVGIVRLPVKEIVGMRAGIRALPTYALSTHSWILPRKPKT